MKPYMTQATPWPGVREGPGWILRTCRAAFAKRHASSLLLARRHTPSLALRAPNPAGGLAEHQGAQGLGHDDVGLSSIRSERPLHPVAASIRLLRLAA